MSHRITLPHERFHRAQGIWSSHHYDPEGNLVDEATWAKMEHSWLPSPDDDGWCWRTDGCVPIAFSSMPLSLSLPFGMPDLRQSCWVLGYWLALWLS